MISYMEDIARKNKGRTKCKIPRYPHLCTRVLLPTSLPLCFVPAGPSPSPPELIVQTCFHYPAPPHTTATHRPMQSTCNQTNQSNTIQPNQNQTTKKTYTHMYRKQLPKGRNSNTILYEYSVTHRQTQMPTQTQTHVQTHCS